MADHHDEIRNRDLSNPVAADGADSIEREASEHEPDYGASAGSVTGVGGTFAAEAAALGVDSYPLRSPVEPEMVEEIPMDEERAAEPS